MAVPISSPTSPARRYCLSNVTAPPDDADPPRQALLPAQGRDETGALRARRLPEELGQRNQHDTLAGGLLREEVKRFRPAGKAVMVVHAERCPGRRVVHQPDHHPVRVQRRARVRRGGADTTRSTWRLVFTARVSW